MVKLQLDLFTVNCDCRVGVKCETHIATVDVCDRDCDAAMLDHDFLAKTTPDD